MSATDATISALVNRSLALRSTDRDVAALLAVEGYRRWPQDARVLSALLGTFTTSPGVVANDYVPGAEHVLGAPVPGTRSAVVAVDGTDPVLWDLEEGRAVQELDLGVEAAYGRQVVVSTDGTRAVVLVALPEPSCGDEDVLGPDGTCGAFVVLDLAASGPVTGPVVLPDGPGAVAISGDGSLVAVTGRDRGTVTVHGVDGAELARVARLPGGTDDDSGGLAFAADGSLYAGSRAGPVREISPRTGAVTRTFDLPPGYSGQHLDVAADGLLVAGGTGGLAAVDLASGERRWAVGLLGGPPDPCAWFVASAQGQRLYCGSHYGEIEERDRTTGQRTGRVFDTQLGDVGPLALTDGGTELVVFGAGSAAITRWRLDGSGPVSSRVADGYVAADRFGYDDDTLLVARRAPDTTVSTDLSDYAIWSTATDTMTDQVSMDATAGGIGWAGRGLLTGMREDVLKTRWYDTAARTVVDGPDIGTECDQLWSTPGGERAYCGGLQGEVWTIDVASRALVGPTLQLPGTWVRSVSELHGGRELVVTFYGDERWETVVVDARTARVLRGPLLGPDVTSVSADGTLVGASDGRITRFDVETLRPLADFPGARGQINALQFGDGGRILLATSNDQSASLYDVATGTRLGDPVVTDAPLIYPAFLHPDGTSLAVTDAAGVLLWDLAPQHLAEAACRVAGRELSATERATYLADLGPVRDTCR